MTPEVLILYSRQGCCLCEGLEQRLKSLPLHLLNPPLELQVIDIDGKEIPKPLKDRYDLQVPVMAFKTYDLGQIFELPRVSPRLDSQGLFDWLQKALLKLNESN